MERLLERTRVARRTVQWSSRSGRGVRRGRSDVATVLLADASDPSIDCTGCARVRVAAASSAGRSE